MNEITNDHLPVGAAATEFSIPYPRLIDACRRGTLPCITVPTGKLKRYFVLRDDLQQYLDKKRKLPGGDCPTIEPKTETTSDTSKGEAVAEGASNSLTAATKKDQPADETPIEPSSALLVAGPTNSRKKGRKTQIQFVKDSMRKLTPAELIKISIWINGRLERVFESPRSSEAPTPAACDKTPDNAH